jgi:hypothetical protein
MKQFLNCIIFNIGKVIENFKQLFICLFNVLFHIMALTTIFIWYIPVIVFIENVEKEIEKRKIEKITEHMDRMFPHKKINK